MVLGIDSAVQEFLKDRKYKNVTAFSSNGKVRNNLGEWKVRSAFVEDNVRGFDFFARKDLEMVKEADIGFMIWNGKSRGTFNDMVNLLKGNKEVVLYYIPLKKCYNLKNTDELYEFLNTFVKLDGKLKKILPQKEAQKFVQISLF